MAKSGWNTMHLSPERHPFQGSGRTPKPKLVRMTGIGSNPGGSGDKISANSAMKKKRPMTGPGTAT